MEPKDLIDLDENVPIDARSMLLDAAYLDGKREALNEVKGRIIDWVKYLDAKAPYDFEEKLRWMRNQEIRKFLMKIFDIDEKELGK